MASVLLRIHRHVFRPDFFACKTPGTGVPSGCRLFASNMDILSSVRLFAPPQPCLRLPLITVRRHSIRHIPPTCPARQSGGTLKIWQRRSSVIVPPRFSGNTRNCLPIVAHFCPYAIPDFPKPILHNRGALIAHTSRDTDRLKKMPAAFMRRA